MERRDEPQFAERAAWAWLAAEGGGLELVTVNPGLVLGPVRAVFGVAETGSVLLTDETLKVNALAYLAQHLVVLLDPSDIVANLHNVYARSEMGKFSYAVLHSGPSATADIEGVLIRGAQGVRSLSVVLAPRPADGPEIRSRG